MNTCQQDLRKKTSAICTTGVAMTVLQLIVSMYKPVLLWRTECKLRFSARAGMVRPYGQQLLSNMSIFVCSLVWEFARENQT